MAKLVIPVSIPEGILREIVRGFREDYGFKTSVAALKESAYFKKRVAEDMLDIWGSSLEDFGDGLMFNKLSGEYLDD